MSGQVILYFDDQADALRFALAAGSVMAGDGTRATDDLVQETTRVTRIRLEDANREKYKNVLHNRSAATPSTVTRTAPRILSRIWSFANDLSL